MSYLRQYSEKAELIHQIGFVRLCSSQDQFKGRLTKGPVRSLRVSAFICHSRSFLKVLVIVIILMVTATTRVGASVIIFLVGILAFAVIVIVFAVVIVVVYFIQIFFENDDFRFNTPTLIG